MVIMVRRERIYGRLFTYVTDPEQAKLIKALTGRETLSETHISVLRTLGVKVKEVPIA